MKRFCWLLVFIAGCGTEGKMESLVREKAAKGSDLSNVQIVSVAEPEEYVEQDPAEMFNPYGVNPPKPGFKPKTIKVFAVKYKAESKLGAKMKVPQPMVLTANVIDDGGKLSILEGDTEGGGLEYNQGGYRLKEKAK